MGSQSAALLQTQLQRCTSIFLDSLQSLTSSTIQSWQDGQLPLSDAKSSIDRLLPLVSDLNSRLESELSLNSIDDNTRSLLQLTRKELITSELRHFLTSSIRDDTTLSSSSPLLLTIYAILDITTTLQETDQIDSGTTLLFIEELNERFTIDSCILIFEYLESRVAYLTQDLSPSKGKGLVLLRLLNDLLRRLSKPSRSHLVLSGRILALLSNVFPLGDRSGVNLRGEFNVANVTNIDSSDSTEVETKQGDQEQEEEDTDKDADPSALAAKDDAFYNSFWGLQRYFSNPVLLFEPVPEVVDVEDQNAADGEAKDTTADKLKQTSSSDSRGDTPLQPSTTSEEKRTAEQNGQAPEAARTSEQEEGEEEGAATSAERGDENEEHASTSAGAYVAPVPPLESLKEATRKVLDVFAEASAREREVEQAERAANKSTAATVATKKRKREEMLQSHVGSQLQQQQQQHDEVTPDAAGAGQDTPAGQDGDQITSADHDGEDGSSFPKYLTGRKVFEYQLRSPAFRRHILLQYLILFQYLLSFNSNQKEKQKDWKNQQLLLSQPSAQEFKLEETDERWIRQCWREIVNLLEETGPKRESRGFKTSVLQTLRRESRWISWKCDNCPSIEKSSLPRDQITTFQKSSESLFFSQRAKYPFSVGTNALSELWSEGLEPIVKSTRRTENSEGLEIEIETDGLEQLELPPGIPSVNSYAKMIKLQEMKIKDLKEREERVNSLNWRALRIARNSSLSLWSKVSSGDVQLLLQAEKDEVQEKEKKQKVEQQPPQESDQQVEEEKVEGQNVTESEHTKNADTTQETEQTGSSGQESNDAVVAEEDTSTTMQADTSTATVIEARDPEPIDVSSTVDPTAADDATATDAQVEAAADETVYVDASSEIEGNDEDGEEQTQGQIQEDTEMKEAYGQV
ncbi:unnamed protein product [Sympodiomycopsis kandeliae]